MSTNAQEPTNNPGDIRSWPVLQVRYPTDPDKIAALLPPGIEPSDESNVILGFYQVPVPDEPENGLMLSVDANYRGVKGEYTICYAIDQEAAVYMSTDMTGQPKCLADVEYYRLGDSVKARCSHQRYTFAEFKGRATGEVTKPASLEDRHEWWVKVLPAVEADKKYDFPPHVVTVVTGFEPVAHQEVKGELILRDSPWDPITTLLPQKGDCTAALVTNKMTKREIQLADPIDPEAFAPHLETISSSRWPGVLGGPQREVDFSTFLT